VLVTGAVVDVEDQAREEPKIWTFGPSRFELHGISTIPERQGDHEFVIALERGDAAFYDIGSWSIDPSGESLALSGIAEAPTLFRIFDANTLRLLDRNGEEISSPLNYDLRRAGVFVAIEPRLVMRGMYSYFADAGLFTDCLTGRRMPVAPEGDTPRSSTPV
jgi:hypothetical protein